MNYLLNVISFLLKSVPEIANGAGETNTFREDVPVASTNRDRLVAAFTRRLGDLMEAPAAISRKE